MNPQQNKSRFNRSNSFTQSWNGPMYRKSEEINSGKMRHAPERFPSKKIHTESSNFEPDFASVLSSTHKTLHDSTPKQLPRYVSPAACIRKAGDRLLELKPLVDNVLKESNQDGRGVRDALETLKNYQLNVVVDLKNIVCDVTEGSTQCLQAQQRTQATDSDTIIKELNSSKESSKFLGATAERSRGLQGNVSIGRAQTNGYRIAASNASSNSMHGDSLLKRIRSRQDLKVSFQQSESQISLREQLRIARQTVSNLTTVNEQLHLKLVNLQQAYAKSRQQTETNRLILQQLNKQVEYLREEVDNLQRINGELENACANSSIMIVLDNLRNQSMQLREDTIRLLNRKESAANPQQMQHILRLEQYIRDLEKGIREENQAKNKFVNEIAIYRQHLEAVEEENRALRIQATVYEGDMICEIQTEESRNQIEPPKTNPFVKYGVPRLTITSPQDKPIWTMPVN